MERIKNNPAVTASAIVALVETGLVMLVALGVVNLDDTQMVAIMAFVAAFIPVVAGIVVREQVVPTRKVRTFIEQERGLYGEG